MSKKSYNNYDKIQFNKKSEYQDLTFKCVNFREGMSKHQIDCDLYCIEKDAMVAHGTIEWIIGRFGDVLDECRTEHDAGRSEQLVCSCNVNMTNVFHKGKCIKCKKPIAN